MRGRGGPIMAAVDSPGGPISKGDHANYGVTAPPSYRAVNRLRCLYIYMYTDKRVVSHLD